ncbi:MAG: hypothetical protein DRR42_21740 [Gammaproteobacteria bacterium]|nr:MAG: hypothetical protein DRR42_21740 [Gammaproteobacteria bacterium]
MRLFAFTIFAVITAVTAVSVCHGEPASDRGAAASGHTLVGQLLLPRGSGSRGVEVVATFTETGSAPRKKWILFDEEGRFADTFRGRLTRMVVSTGLRTQLHSIEAEDLPEINQTGQVDVGVIDLRDRLIRHRLILRVAEGASQGDVRVAMFFGLPHVGPSGEPVSLGSRQFPPVALGSEMEWLLPLKAQSLYFLVERPVGPALEPEWRGGYQRLFGPFTSSNLPTELTMD